MEKDIDRIPKNPDTDIVIRIDDFGGKTGLTIREFVKSERYTGFTKAGTRIPADQVANFKKAVASINEADLESPDTQETVPPEQKEISVGSPQGVDEERGSSSKSESDSNETEDIEEQAI